MELCDKDYNHFALKMRKLWSRKFWMSCLSYTMSLLRGKNGLEFRYSHFWDIIIY